MDMGQRHVGHPKGCEIREKEFDKEIVNGKKVTPTRLEQDVLLKSGKIWEGYYKKVTMEKATIEEKTRIRQTL